MDCANIMQPFSSREKEDVTRSATPFFTFIRSLVDTLDLLAQRCRTTSTMGWRRPLTVAVVTVGLLAAGYLTALSIFVRPADAQPNRQAGLEESNARVCEVFVSDYQNALRGHPRRVRHTTFIGDSSALQMLRVTAGAAAGCFAAAGYLTPNGVARANARIQELTVRISATRAAERVVLSSDGRADSALWIFVFVKARYLVDVVTRLEQWSRLELAQAACSAGLHPGVIVSVGSWDMIRPATESSGGLSFETHAFDSPDDAAWRIALSSFDSSVKRITQRLFEQFGELCASRRAASAALLLPPLPNCSAAKFLFQEGSVPGADPYRNLRGGRRCEALLRSGTGLSFRRELMLHVTTMRVVDLESFVVSRRCGVQDGTHLDTAEPLCAASVVRALTWHSGR